MSLTGLSVAPAGRNSEVPESTDTLESLREQIAALEQEKAEWIARFNKLPEIVAHAEERGRLVTKSPGRRPTRRPRSPHRRGVINMTSWERICDQIGLDPVQADPTTLKMFGPFGYTGVAATTCERCGVEIKGLYRLCFDCLRRQHKVAAPDPPTPKP